MTAEKQIAFGWGVQPAGTGCTAGMFTSDAALLLEGLRRQPLFHRVPTAGLKPNVLTYVPFAK